MEANKTIAIAKEFTDTYRKYANNKYLREAYCCKIQWQSQLLAIRKNDLFAGRRQQAMFDFTPQSDDGYLGYCLHPEVIEKFRSENTLSITDEATLNQLISFWKAENTVTKTRKAFTPQMTAALPSDLYYAEPGIAFTLWRMSGVQMDFGKLVRLGIPGLRAEIANKKLNTTENSNAWHLYTAMDITLDTFCDVCHYYANQAELLANTCFNKQNKDDLLQLVQILKSLPNNKPSNFREGIQLIFLYAILDGVRNYSRLDEALAEQYCHDIDNHIITEEEAIRLLSGLWQLIIARNYRYDSRIIIGGLGRTNETKANRLALTIMETTRRVKDIVPQLALRFHSQQDPALYQKALDIIGDGNPFPMLYNDEVNIPSVQNAFNLPYNEAVHAIQYGCGEYVINHRSVGTPSAVINLLAALNVTLHKGIEPITGKPLGMPAQNYLKYGNFETFDQLWNAYKEQVEYHIAPLAEHEKLEYDYAGYDAPFLYESMLMDDCIARGKGMYEGGIRYLGGTLETYGNSNTADSLTAIKQLVYDQKKFSLNQLLTMLDCNFEGYEKERKQLLDCPKYGNDNTTADDMLLQVHNHVCNYTRAQGPIVGLHSYLVVVINNDANTCIGEQTAASADGRKANTYMNPGNAPVGGADKNGITAFLNSVVKPATDIHAGAVQNMKFSKELFTHQRSNLQTLLFTYWQKGGAQAMLTVVGKGDLEAALEHPELYQNLIVRVGGFSERFVNLPRNTQMEILSRTLY